MVEGRVMQREFSSGAVRDTDVGKLDYEGFLSPLVFERFAQYMHEHRKLADGSIRASDNWQRGIPLDSYMKSGFRHFMEWWKLHRSADDNGLRVEDALCGVMFNVQGYLHEILKSRSGEE
jgi:hypothetical protein